jgi:repressor LexA
MKKRKLTERQEQFYNFIKHYIEKNGYSPSYKEIGEALGVASTGTIPWALTALAKKGWITRNAGEPRTIQLLELEGLQKRGNE